MNSTKKATDPIEAILKRCFKPLSFREQFIVTCVEGLLPKIPKRTLADVGRELDISRERTRQLYNRSIIKFEKIALSVPVQKKIKNIFSSIEMPASGNNLFDFYTQVRSKYPNKEYESITCMSLLYRYISVQLVTKKNEVLFSTFFTELKPENRPNQNQTKSNSFPLIDWFQGLNKKELSYLNERFNIFKSITKLKKQSIPVNLWTNLKYKALYSYLIASEKYPVVKNGLNRILAKIELKQGSISSESIEKYFKEEYNTKGINILGLCFFLADFSNKFKYDPKHFLWIINGYSWRHNKRFNHNRTEILMATGKAMSHTNIAHMILLEEKQPMTVKSIVKSAIERGLMKTTSSNPGGGLKTLVYLEIQRDRKLFRDSRFRILPDWRIELTGLGREFSTGDGRLSRQSSKQTIADCAYKILLESKKAMHYNDIYTAIRKHPRMRMRDDSSEQSIKRVLSAERNKEISRFKKLKNDYWTLSANHEDFIKS